MKKILSVILPTLLLFIMLSEANVSFSQEIPENFYDDFLLYDNNISNAEINLSIDKFLYKPGDIISVFGYVNEYRRGDFVIITLTDNLGNVKSKFNIPTNKEGFFEIQEKIPDYLKFGEYFLVSKYGTNGVQLSLNFSIEGEKIETIISIPQNSYLTDGGMTFFPNEVIVEASLPIIWINNDETVHTVVSGSKGFGNKLFSDGKFASGSFGPNSLYELKIEEVGDYNYFCKLHPWLTGKITVVPLTQKIQQNVEPIKIEKKFLSINKAETTDNWSQILCDFCKGDVKLSSDSKEGKTSLEWFIQGSHNSTGKNPLLHLEFPVTNIESYEFLEFWIKTEGNVNEKSKIALLDSKKEFRVLESFNSQSYGAWTEIQISLNEFILESENFDSTLVQFLQIKLPNGEDLVMKQQKLNLDGLRFVEKNVQQLESEGEPLIRIQTERNVYFISEQINMSGTIKNRESNLPVSIQVFDPKNNLILLNQLTPHNITNGFSFLIPTLGNFFDNEGEYLIKAQYGVKNYRDKIKFELKNPQLIEKNYNGYDIYFAGKYIAVPIPFVEGYFSPERLQPGGYKITWNENSLDELKKILDENPMGPLFLKPNFKGFDIYFFSGSFFGILKEESKLEPKKIDAGQYTILLKSDSMKNIEEKISEHLMKEQLKNDKVESEIKNLEPQDSKDEEKEEVIESIDITSNEEIQSNDYSIIILQILLVIGVLSAGIYYSYKKLRG